MKMIIIKIKLCDPTSGTMLKEISKALERYLKRKKIDYRCIDASIKLDKK